MNRTKVGDLAIIKATGNQETIRQIYGKISIKLDMKFDDVELPTNGTHHSQKVTDSTSSGEAHPQIVKILKNSETHTTLVHPDSDIRKDGWYYTLTDGREYHEEDIIVSVEEIREYKINQIDGIQ
jgi:hypothetical protein